MALYKIELLQYGVPQLPLGYVQLAAEVPPQVAAQMPDPRCGPAVARGLPGDSYCRFRVSLTLRKLGTGRCNCCRSRHHRHGGRSRAFGRTAACLALYLRADPRSSATRALTTARSRCSTGSNSTAGPWRTAESHYAAQADDTAASCHSAGDRRAAGSYNRARALDSAAAPGTPSATCFPTDPTRSVNPFLGIHLPCIHAVMGYVLAAGIDGCARLRRRTSPSTA